MEEDSTERRRQQRMVIGCRGAVPITASDEPPVVFSIPEDYTRCVQCSRRSKRQEEEVSMCEHATLQIPIEQNIVVPRIQLPGLRTRSPRIHIDLNVEPKEENAESGLDPDANPIDQENTESGLDPDADAVAQENVESGLDPDADAVAQENVESGLDPDADAVAQENVESGLDPDVDPIDQENAYSGLDPDDGPVAQENAHRNVVPNDKRRVIFDVLLAKARNGNLKGHETQKFQ